MRIDVRYRGGEAPDALRTHVLRRVQADLGRFRDHLTLVVVRVADVNGSSGGTEKRCQVTVYGGRLGLAAVNDVSGDPRVAIDLAVERVAGLVGRHLAQVEGRAQLRRAS
jgi:Sigma 54 modulation protein / S30EA ribosomal protein